METEAKTKKGIVDNDDQGNLFGLSSTELVRDAVELRIDYSIPSPSFSELGLYLPPDKSIKREGAIFAVSSNGDCQDGECQLDLGSASGTYAVMAIPLPTNTEDRGPNGEYSVAALIRPVAVGVPVKKKRQKAQSETKSLFD